MLKTSRDGPDQRDLSFSLCSVDLGAPSDDSPDDNDKGVSESL